MILISLLTCKIFGQLAFYPSYIFEKFPVFDNQVIQQNKISKIIFDIIDKKDWQEAVDRNLVEVYEFYPDGQLKRKYHTNIKKVIQYETINKKHKTIVTHEQYEYDTISVSYTYQNHLIIERQQFPNGYIEATYYKKCGDFICKEEKYIETYKTLSNNIKVLDKLLLKAQDSIATYDFKNQIKQVFYNNEHLPYKEKFIYKNDLNEIVEISEQFVAATGRIKQSFHYKNHLLESAVMIVDYGITEKYYIEYTYDDKQRVLSEKHFKNEQQLKEYQYIYDENNQLLKSILIRTFEDKNIRIIKLKYEYY